MNATVELDPVATAPGSVFVDPRGTNLLEPVATARRSVFVRSKGYRPGTSNTGVGVPFPISVA
jgi:hypothetical protein